MEGHENAKEAKKKLQEYKAKMVAEVNEESQELMRRALEEVSLFWQITFKVHNLYFLQKVRDEITISQCFFKLNF